MISKSKRIFTQCITLLLAMTLLFTSSAAAVWAKESGDDADREKKEYLDKPLTKAEQQLQQGVHKNPATFEKNFDLSWEQKKDTIIRIEKIVKDKTKPAMSDLEKYYTLAVEGNKLVTYDWQFWSGGYDFDYYSHQWDSYGAMNEKSVCVGIAIFYTHLCHAADLPCWFARINPDTLDHTISYIPNINGNAYYVDVTENMFLMSNKSNPFAPVDKAFSHITKDCTNTAFDYIGADGESYNSTAIKECYNKPYSTWFKEYALHIGTDKNFPTPYVEKGSGTAGKHIATYKGYRSNFTDKPDVWFLDDFYRNPAALKAKILNKEFDDQLVNVAGVKKNYDCDTPEDLVEAVKNDISLEYFPSLENGNVVAKVAKPVQGSDYEVSCTDFDLEGRTAELTVKAIGSNYKGSYKFNVKLFSAVVSKDPVPKAELIYNGRAQELVEPGEAEGGEMQYAIGTNARTAPAEGWSTSVPAATNAGKYFVWYRAVGKDDLHASGEPKCLRQAVSIYPIYVDIIVDNLMTIKVGETATITPEVDIDVPVKFIFESWNPEIATVDDNGVVTGVVEGVASIGITATIQQSASNYEVNDFRIVTVEVEGDPKKNTYLNVSGDGSSWIKGSSNTLNFVFKHSSDDDKTFDLFTGIHIDGEYVSDENYTTESGSIIIKLKPEYLETLALGKHSLTAFFEDGSESANATFTIKSLADGAASNKDDSISESDSGDKSGQDVSKSGSGSKGVKTGDEQNVSLWLIMLIASAAFIAAVSFRRQ